MRQSVHATGSYANLDVSLDGPVMSVGLNRPHKRNAIDDATVLALEACL